MGNMGIYLLQSLDCQNFWQTKVKRNYPTSNQVTDFQVPINSCLTSDESGTCWNNRGRLLDVNEQINSFDAPAIRAKEKNEIVLMEQLKDYRQSRWEVFL